jgi:hypothetical protein
MVHLWKGNSKTAFKKYTSGYVVCPKSPVAGVRSGKKHSALNEKTHAPLQT